MDFKMKLILLTVPAWVSAKVYSGCSIPVNSKDGKRKRLTCPQEPWGLQHSHHSWEKMHRETGFELAILLPQPLEPLGLQIVLRTVADDIWHLPLQCFHSSRYKWKAVFNYGVGKDSTNICLKPFLFTLCK
ncbi:uncharacterized protein LOC144378064 isoform X1 [Ictidomys tridecemlineatus]